MEDDPDKNKKEKEPTGDFGGANGDETRTFGARRGVNDRKCQRERNRQPNLLEVQQTQEDRAFHRRDILSSLNGFGKDVGKYNATERRVDDAVSLSNAAFVSRCLFSFSDG
jgi:hypothetical protein